MRKSYSVQSLSHIHLFATPWTVAHQAPLSMEFSQQEYWSGLPFPSAGGLPDPGIKPGSLALQADSLDLSHQGSPNKQPFTEMRKSPQRLRRSICFGEWKSVISLRPVRFTCVCSISHVQLAICIVGRFSTT